MKISKSVIAVAAVFCATAASPARSQELLTGDTRLACEAVLCLASGTRPDACIPSLTRYFSIQFRYPWETIQGRINFLNLCPSSSASAPMQSLVNALANGAGSCDPASLNQSLRGNDEDNNLISNTLPAFCVTLYSQPYVDVNAITPVYVGQVNAGGY